MSMNWRRLSLGLLLSAVLPLLATTSAAQPGGYTIDPTHYWTYKLVDPVQIPPTPVFVRDQFFRNGVPVTVDRLERLVNWVHKNGSQVRDTFLHYTWWNVIEPHPMPRSVDILNQFGLFPVDVHHVEFLLAPAWKNEPQPVFPPANHYLCYRAFGPPPPPQTYLLADEWRVDQQVPGPLEYLCLPCSKQHQGAYFEAPDTLTHLALYPIHPGSERFYPFIADQFLSGPRLVQQTPIEYLLVPSEKFEPPTPAGRSTWGRIKSLVR